MTAERDWYVTITDIKQEIMTMLAKLMYDFFMIYHAYFCFFLYISNYYFYYNILH